MKHKYPEDGGLQEPVRTIGEVFNAFAMLREHFTMRRITPDPLSRGEQFNITRFGRLFYRADNTKCAAGHIRLFGKGPGRGWCVYAYRTQESYNKDSALHRVWNFGLFAIHHIEPGKKTWDPAGWHITRASLKVSRGHGSISLTWRKADVFRPKKAIERGTGGTW